MNLSQKSPSNLPPTPSVPRHANKLVNIQNGEQPPPELTVETNLQSSRDSQPSPLSNATTINIHHQNRAPMLSASDAMHTTSFVRGVSLVLPFMIRNFLFPFIYFYTSNFIHQIELDLRIKTI